MTLTVYKGQSASGSPAIQRTIGRYVVNDQHIAASLLGGILTKDILSGDLVTVVINDEKNGTISKLCKYVSYNYQVIDSASSPSADTVADNTLLFEVIY